MNIELFSEMIRNLVLDNEEVTLPGLGTFVSEVMPASFSDRGYTINPPYRKLSFRQRGSDDGKLAMMYSQANSTDLESAQKIIKDFVLEIKETLQTRKMVLFPGLGRLRATRENAFFFIPDEDIDIYQYGFGLEPVSLKTHEETPEEVSAAVADLKSLLEEPVVAPVAPEPAPEAVPEPTPEPTPEPMPEPEAIEPALEPEPAPAQKPEPVELQPEPVESQPVAVEAAPIKKRGPWTKLLIVLLCLILLAAIFFGGFILLSRIAPDFIDSILYTPEELRIINY